MDRNIQKNGIINFFALLTTAVGGIYVAKVANSRAGEAGVIFLGLGALVTIVSWFQMRLETRERLEKLEFDELSRTKNASTLFNTEEAETFPARLAREQFERWLVPGFTIVLLALQGLAAGWLWRRVLTGPPDLASQSALAMAVYAFFALVLFMLGKYSGGIARLEHHRLLRPSASYLLLGAYLCFLATLTCAADEFGFPKVDTYAVRALCVILTLTALENLLTLTLEIYRPRRKGEVKHLLYDSRLIGLLGQPESLFTTAAQTLDYQFGFKVSDTAFYRSTEKYFPLLMWGQLLALFFSTSVVFIEPSEEALLERFGSPVAGRAVLQPGHHFKWPWPVDGVHRFRTREIQSLNIGYVPDPEKENENTLLWTKAHYKEEFNLLVASREQETQSASLAGDKKTVPANLLTLSIPVQFVVSDVLAWATNHANAEQLLEKMATREVVRYLVSVDLGEIMSTGRQQAAQTLQAAIQKRADEQKLGIKILFVGLQDIHPPVKVADAFEVVVGALQQKEARIQNAQGYLALTNALGEANAFRLVREAEAYQLNRTNAAAAQAAQFTNQITAFMASPEVYPQRAYYQTFARAAAGARKFVIAPTNTEDVVQFNLEDKVRKDLLDIQIPTGKR